jgi:hypothetical protein
MYEPSGSSPALFSPCRRFALFIVLICIVIAAPLSAQNRTADPNDCGIPDVSFDVKTRGNQHPVAQPEPGKALIYFFQDDSLFGEIPRPTSRYAIDGSWVGATHANSYFYLSIPPGEHHLCTDWQDSDSQQAAALHFTAQPGASYFFRAENISTRLQWSVRFEPIDSDEGLLLIRRFALAISHPHK